LFASFTAQRYYKYLEYTRILVFFLVRRAGLGRGSTGDTATPVLDQKLDNTSKNAIGSCVFRKKVVPLLRISKKSCTFAAAKGNAKRQKHNVSN